MAFRPLALGILLGAVAVPVVAARAADPAVQRIDAYNQAIVGVMKQGRALGMAGRAEKFQPIVATYYDTAAAAALVVGAPAWAKAPAADRAALVAALTRHNAVSHAANYKSYSGETFTADPQSVARGAERLVRVRVGGTNLVYRLRESGGAWRIVDVVADGVSQLAVQRADYASTVAAGGAAGLAKQLAAMDAKTLKSR